MPRKYQKREPEFSAPDAAPAAEEVKPEEPAAPVVVAPPPPNPAVTAIQQDIVNLVRDRREIRQKMFEAQMNLMNAQNRFQMAQGEMKSLEDEIQYLHGQCAQLDGRQDVIGVNFPSPGSLAYPGSVGSILSVSSEPTMPQNRPGSPFASPDGVNRAHANRADVI